MMKRKDCGRRSSYYVCDGWMGMRGVEVKNE